MVLLSYYSYWARVEACARARTEFSEKVKIGVSDHHYHGDHLYTGTQDPIWRAASRRLNKENKTEYYSVSVLCFSIEVVSLIHESVETTCTYTFPADCPEGMDSGDLDAAEIGYVAPKWVSSLTYRR